MKDSDIALVVGGSILGGLITLWLGNRFVKNGISFLDRRKKEKAIRLALQSSTRAANQFQHNSPTEALQLRHLVGSTTTVADSLMNTELQRSAIACVTSTVDVGNGKCSDINSAEATREYVGRCVRSDGNLNLSLNRNDVLGEHTLVAHSSRRKSENFSLSSSYDSWEASVNTESNDSWLDVTVSSESVPSLASAPSSESAHRNLGSQSSLDTFMHGNSTSSGVQNSNSVDSSESQTSGTVYTVYTTSSLVSTNSEQSSWGSLSSESLLSSESCNSSLVQDERVEDCGSQSDSYSLPSTNSDEENLC